MMHSWKDNTVLIYFLSEVEILIGVKTIFKTKEFKVVG